MDGDRDRVLPPTVYRDPKTGRFKRAWRLSSKGYPRFHIKRYRDRYVHIVMIEHYIGRKLKKWEDCDHRDGNKLNWSRKNLRVMDHSVHGFVSSRQAWLMKNLWEPREAHAWNEWFGEGATEITVESQGYGQD